MTVRGWRRAIDGLIKPKTPAPGGETAAKRPIGWSASTWEGLFRSFAGRNYGSFDEMLARAQEEDWAAVDQFDDEARARRDRDEESMLKAIGLLLSMGWDPSRTGALGRNGLHHAAMSGLPSVVRALADAGADARARDELGKRASDYARGAGLDEMARELDARAERRDIESVANNPSGSRGPAPRRL